jgi:hypothetical protein
MSVYTQDFNATTDNALPAGWSGDTELGASPTNAIEGAKSLQYVGSVDSAHNKVAWRDTPDTVDGDVLVSARLGKSGSTSGTIIFVTGLVARVTAGTAFSNMTGYLLGCQQASSGAGQGFFVDRVNAGTATQLQLIGDGTTFAFQTHQYDAYLQVVGATVKAKIQRVTDSKWLQADNTWGDTEVWPIDLTDGTPIDATGTGGKCGAWGYLSGSIFKPVWDTFRIEEDPTGIHTPHVPQAFYVNATGNDGNAGTIGAPFLTGQHAINQLVDGDLGVFLNGGDTFAGPLLLEGLSGTDADNPLVIGSYGTGRAIIQSDGQSPGIQRKNCNHVHIGTRDGTVLGLDIRGGGVTDNGDGTTDFDLTSPYTNIGIDDTSEGQSDWLVGNNHYHCKTSGFCRGELRRADLEDFGFRDCDAADNEISNCADFGLGFRGGSTYHTVGATWIDYADITGASAGDGSHGEGNGSTGRGTHKNLHYRNYYIHDIFGDHRITATSSGDGFKGGNVLNDDGLPLITGFRIKDCGINCQAPGGGNLGGYFFECDGCNVEYCIVSGTRGAGSDCGGLGSDGGNNNCGLFYNLTFDNKGPGLQMGNYGGPNVTGPNVCAFNVSVGDGIGLRQFSGNNQGHEFVHNTVYLPLGACFQMVTGNGFFARNNIFFARTGQKVFDGNTLGVYWENNIVVAQDGSCVARDNGVTYATLAAWIAAGTGIFNDNLDEDPLLTGGDPDGTETVPSDYLGAVLLAGSPAIGAGIDLSGVAQGAIDPGATDFYGNDYVAATPDIGAAVFVAVEETDSRERISWRPRPTLGRRTGRALL